MSAYSALKLKERRTPCNGSIIANLIPLANLAMNQRDYMDMTGVLHPAERRPRPTKQERVERVTAAEKYEVNNNAGLIQIRNTLRRIFEEIKRTTPELYADIVKFGELAQELVDMQEEDIMKLNVKERMIDELQTLVLQLENANKVNNATLGGELKLELSELADAREAISVVRKKLFNQPDSTRTLFENPILHMKQDLRAACLDVLSGIAFGQNVDKDLGNAISTAKNNNLQTLEQDLARVYNKAKEYLDQNSAVTLTSEQAGVLAALGLNSDKAAKPTAFKINDTIHYFGKADGQPRQHNLQREVPIMDLLMGLASNRVIDDVASLENPTDKELDVAAAAFTLLTQAVQPIDAALITSVEKDRCESIIRRYVIDKNIEFLGSSLKLRPCCELGNSLQGRNDDLSNTLTARHIRLHTALGDH